MNESEGTSLSGKVLAGKVALITGAVRRSGRATALELAGMGAAIAINTRRSRDEAEAVVREIEARGGRDLQRFGQQAVVFDFDRRVGRRD